MVASWSTRHGLAWLLWLLSTLPAMATSHYDDLIGATARRHGLAPALIKAVIKCESNFEAQAVSARGAQGLMQLMPATQATLGVANVFDPRQNIDAGARYLALLQRTFGDDAALVLAAYNAGPQTVIDAGYTVPPYPETQHYLACVLAAQQHYEVQHFNSRFPKRAARTPMTNFVTTSVHLSHPTARTAQRLLVHLEALNASPHVTHGVVNLTYPEGALSLLALHITEGNTIVRLPASQYAPVSSTSHTGHVYQFLRGAWPDWQPGQRRTAVLALVPRHTRAIALHLSVLLYTPNQTTAPERWSTVLRIPVHPARGHGSP
jgi:hypothetical protein